LALVSSPTLRKQVLFSIQVNALEPQHL
jgi:hypothetical protein